MLSRSALVLLIATSMSGVASAASDTAKADAERRKPLQRCDELKDKAELECLKKAREHIVEARKKRESATAQAKTTSGKSVPEAKTPVGKSADAAEAAKKN